MDDSQTTPPQRTTRITPAIFAPASLSVRLLTSFLQWFCRTGFAGRVILHLTTLEAPSYVLNLQANGDPWLQESQAWCRCVYSVGKQNRKVSREAAKGAKMLVPQQDRRGHRHIEEISHKGTKTQRRKAYNFPLNESQSVGRHPYADAVRQKTAERHTVNQRFTICLMGDHRERCL